MYEHIRVLPLRGWYGYVRYIYFTWVKTTEIPTWCARKVRLLSNFKVANRMYYISLTLYVKIKFFEIKFLHKYLKLQYFEITNKLFCDKLHLNLRDPNTCTLSGNCTYSVRTQN